jgi:predicted Rossmann fold flavoprotein
LAAPAASGARSSDVYDVIVIGAGAAGLLAAAVAAERGRRVLLVEKNRKVGVKILMSGGTRCNLTQATDERGIVRAYREQGKFLHSALAALGPADLVKLIEDEGVPTKVEETGKIFPVSNRAVDVVEALLTRLRRSGAELLVEAAVEGLEARGLGTGDGGQGTGRFLVTVRRGRDADSRREVLEARSVILTTGGKSYPGSGTTGDGYAIAAAFGHTIVPPRPALVPLTTDAAWVRELSGITIPDLRVTIWGSTDGQSIAPGQKKPLDERRGSVLLAHFGLSGPAILDISRTVTAAADPRSLVLACDFSPDLRADQLEAGLRDLAARDGKKQLAAAIAPDLPRRLVEQLLRLAGLAPEIKLAELPKAGRARLVSVLKGATVPLLGTRGFAKAEVTAGGVSLAEVDSRRMESKLIPGFFLAGEVLDLDGPIGGYNFQAAFSTGYLAGMSV